MNPIDELNIQIKATVGVSKIHGVGVMALRKIRKGELVYANALPKIYRIPFGSLGKLFPEVRKVILDRWPSIVNDSVIVAHDVRLVSLMNHSPDPNYEPETDTALRDVEDGEEITEDYTKMPNWENIWPINKNQWLSATNAEKSKSLRNTLVALLAKLSIKFFAPNWTHGPNTTK